MRVPLPMGGLSCASPSGNGWSKLSESVIGFRYDGQRLVHRGGGRRMGGSLPYTSTVYLSKGRYPIEAFHGAGPDNWGMFDAVEHGRFII